jgi:hypothetical protein
MFIYNFAGQQINGNEKQRRCEMGAPNRRLSPRQGAQETIEVLLIPRGAEIDRKNIDLIPGKICNQSRDGLYMETDRTLEPGSNVSIKMVSPEADHPANAYYMRDGQVIWCKKIDDRISRFGVGVKILRKVVQADVLTSHFR